MKSLKYGLPLFLFIKSITAFSQASCDSMTACDCMWRDLSPAGIMVGHEHAKGTWKISYRYMSMMMEGKLHNTTSVDDNYVFNNYLMSPQSMQMDMHMLMGMYGFTNKFSVMAMLNYNVQTMKMTMLPGTMHMHGSTMMMSDANSTNMSSQSSGLGDTKVYLVYAIVNHNVHHVFLSEGFNIPSGKINMKGKDDDAMYPNTQLPYMMQMGSGTFDFMPGITYLLKQSKLSVSVQVTSVIRPFYNSLEYSLPNEITGNVWVAYKWFPWISTSLRAEENSIGKIAGKDVQLTENLEPAGFTKNYGGQFTTAFGGINFYFTKTWLKNTRFTVEYGVPLYQNVNGVQLAQKSSLFAGWLVSF